MDEARTADTDVPDPGDLDVSVVLPVFNRRRQFREELDRIRSGLEASPYSFEIIVVDDGSNDGSSALLREVDGIRLIQFDRPRGTGTARRVGTEAARGRVVVWTDADLTYPNHEIPRLVDELEGWDQVVGTRPPPQGPPGRARARWPGHRPAGWRATSSGPPSRI